MVTEEMVYWITRLDDIRFFMQVCSIVCVIVASIMATVYIFSAIDKTMFIGMPHFLLVLLLVLAAFIFGAGRAFIPTTREMCAIKVIPMIANNEDLRGIGADVRDLAREWLRELKPNSAISQEAEKAI